MGRKIREINWEKISVYIACLAFIYMIWQSQNSIKDSITKISERIRALEVENKYLSKFENRIEKIEEKVK